MKSIKVNDFMSQTPSPFSLAFPEIPMKIQNPKIIMIIITIVIIAILIFVMIHYFTKSNNNSKEMCRINDRQREFIKYLGALSDLGPSDLDEVVDYVKSTENVAPLIAHPRREGEE